MQQISGRYLQILLSKLPVTDIQSSLPFPLRPNPVKRISPSAPSTHSSLPTVSTYLGLAQIHSFLSTLFPLQPPLISLPFHHNTCGWFANKKYQVGVLLGSYKATDMRW